MKKLIFYTALAALLLAAPTVFAAETIVFDSTDNYLGGCSYTSTSEWTLSEDVAVTKIQLWYYWQAGETELPVTVTKGGQPFATYTATRGACDPYQTSWCNADYDINKTFPSGTYATSIPTNYQCLKPGSTGTVRLYSETEAVAAATNTNTAAANANRAANAAVQNANTQAVATTADDSDDGEEGGMVTYVLGAIIVILVIIIVVMYIKCPKKVAVK